MKPDEYERARKLICQLGTYGSCEFCSLSDVDDCREQTDEAEKILLELLGICPKGYEEEEKEECRSDVAAKNRVDTIIKGLREVQEKRAWLRKVARLFLVRLEQTTHRKQ